MRITMSRRTRWLAGVAAGLLAVGVTAPVFATNGDDDESAQARNVILFIGDGMGDSEITLARNYEAGAGGRLNMDELPNAGQMTTYSVQQDDPELPNYNVDSSASATSWSTGQKSYNGAISVDVDGNPIPNLSEVAQDNGLRTGNVSTGALQDATPAAQSAHMSSRDCWGPDVMEDCPDEATENGGIGSIAEQQAASDADLILGGGMDSFSQEIRGGEYEGQTALDKAGDNGFDVVETAEELQDADGSDPLLGVFAEEHLETEWTGPEATEGGTDPTECTANPDFPENQPRLPDMTQKALDILDEPDSDTGFFLQVEGASIDKRAHAAEPCGQIGETVAFDEALAAGQEFAADNPETLVLVTGDHAHSTQIVSAGQETPGKTATLVTKEGGEMTVNYATNADGAQSHTGTQIRVAGDGPASEEVVGLIDQTDLFDITGGALGID